MTDHLRILMPQPGVIAFYDGRVADARFSEAPNWVDDGALSLGIASYAIFARGEAIVYDTHVSVAHGDAIRRTLAEAGVSRITVVLSHWHLDHVAGSAVFRDCEIIANAKTAAHLAAKRSAIEAGTCEGPPAISPLVLPTATFSGEHTLSVGGERVSLIEADIHSDDATVLWLPDRKLLLAGDTMEDTITYLTEPEGLDRHLRDLDRLYALGPERILPNHGDPSVIAKGGYQKTLVRATQQYIRTLKRARTEPEIGATPLRELIGGPLSAGWITWFDAYQAVHEKNLALLVAREGHHG